MLKSKQKKSILSSAATIAIIAMLILSQPATSLILYINTDKENYILGETVTFTPSIIIQSGERIPIDQVKLQIIKDGTPYDELIVPYNETTNYPVSGSNINANVTVVWDNVTYEDGNLVANFSGTQYNWGYGYGYGNDSLNAYINYTITWTVPSTVQYQGNYTVQLIVSAATDSFTSQMSNFSVEQLDQLTITIDTPSDSSYTNQSTIWVNGTVNDPSLTTIQRALQSKGTFIIDDDFESGLGSWTTENNPFYSNYWQGPELWHIADDIGNSFWVYNDVNTGTYYTSDNGMDTPNAATLWSESFTVMDTDTKLVFDTWWDTEIGPNFDNKLIVVQNGSDKDIIGIVVDPPPDQQEFDENQMAEDFKTMLQPTYEPLGYNFAETLQVAWVYQHQWDVAEFSLGAYSGSTIKVGFLFNTVDEWANDFTGWKIDNVQVVGKGTSYENITVTDQTFNVSVTLKEGPNLVQFFADNGYLQTSTEVNVIKDSTPPQVGFTVTSNYTNSSTFNITWYVYDMNFSIDNLQTANLYLNGEMVQKVTSSGETYKQRSINEGENTLQIIATDKAGNTNTTSMNVTLDTTAPNVTVMTVVYPTGVVSARPGDEAVIRVNASDSGVGVSGVYLISPGGGGPDENSSEPDQFPMIESHEFYKLMWDIEDATHFAPMVIPTDVAIITGNYTFNITVYDRAMNSVTTSVNVSITSTLSAFNLEFMPGWNLISLPLIPDNGNISAMFGNVSEIESIWSYDANTSSWSVYTPGPAPDNLTTVDTGIGYWVLTNSSAFTTIQVPDAPLPPVAVPVKVNYSGVYLQAGQVPPTYNVYAGWNLIGFHSEVNMTASEYLSGLTYPTRTWTSLIGYDNYVDFKNNKVADGIFDRLQPSDYMKPGSGYWLYVKQAGEITP
jgi:hypothetical protein